MKSNLLQLVVAFGAVATFMSCSKDMTNPSYEEIQKQSYVTSFVAKYGEIDANQTWDFATGERQLSTRGFSTIKTQVLENGINFGDVSQIKSTVKNASWLHSEIQIPGGVGKNGQLLDAMVTALPEAKAKTGKPAVLVAPSSGFYIFPIFSGGCLTFDLKVKVGDQDPVTVFTKDWINFQTINGMKKDTVYADGSTVNMKGIYIEAPVGTPIEVYIDNIYCHTKAAGNSYNKSFPSPAGTTNGRAIYVDIPDSVKPELDGYMIEDLGAIGDFDFNDVVVDVEDYTVETHKLTRENGVIKSDETISTTSAPSKAIIRAMGGTIDFELSIGDTKWVKSENGFDVKTMYNTQGKIDYDKVLAEFEVTGWDYKTNNIGVKVMGKDGKLYSIKFPKAGEAPMIIAVDPTQKWMGERISVPSSWFYTK